MDMDNILQSTGECGKFQIRAYIPLCCVVIFSVFQMSYIFVARDTKYRCKIESCQENSNSNEYNPPWLINAVPFKDEVPNRCLYYEPANNNTCSHFHENKTNTCDDFIFEINQTTIVQDFNITCDENLWKLTIVGTINAVGELFCLPFSGFLSDRFGRKRMLVIGMAFSTLFGLLRSFSPWLYLYMAFEFLDTFLGAGIYSAAFILALEIVHTDKRSLGNTIICLAFAVGQVLLGLAAWISPSWRTLLRILYAPGILVTIFSLWCVPESIRWLMSKNNSKDACKILNAASKLNKGVEFNPEILVQSEEISAKEKTESFQFADILKSKVLVLRIVHCSYTWLCCNFPYYGLTIQAVALSENVYLNYISSALIEVPAYLLTQKIMASVGRRKTMAFSLILGGVACLCVHVANSSWLILAVFLSGKFFITVAYTTLYIYTAEMFPTNSRHSIFAICSMFGRIGTMLAPQVPLLERVFKFLPLLIFSIMALTSGVLAFWFPETLNTELPDEVEQAVSIENKSY